MPGNLVICCDGTANEFKKDRTNVLKLAFAATKDEETQRLYYHPGVGTMASAGFVTAIGQWVARIAGMAFGYGLKRDIADVYTFIMDHYEPGDRIYIFGLSRGAYTARAVTALLHEYGLLGRGNAALVPYAIRLLWKFDKAKGADARSACFHLAQEFKEALSVRECHPHFLGLWDTVGSVGWIANPLSSPTRESCPVSQSSGAPLRSMNGEHSSERILWRSSPNETSKRFGFPASIVTLGAAIPRRKAVSPSCHLSGGSEGRPGVRPSAGRSSS